MSLKVPKAPSWTVVFLFGIGWNAIVERSPWAVAVCIGIWTLGWVLVQVGDAIVNLSRR